MVSCLMPWLSASAAPAVEAEPVPGATEKTPPGAKVTRSGWLTVTWGDGPPASGLTSTLLALIADNGELTPILMDEAVARPHGGVAALNRMRVTLVGQWANPQAPETSTLQVQSVQLDSSASAFSAPSSIAAAAISGSQPWVNILCKFADISTEPKPLSYFDGLLGETKPGLGHYWRESSYDSVNILGSGSVGWYTLPQTRAYYVGLGSSAMLDRLFADCTGAADGSVFFPSYLGINLMFNGELDGYAWGGSQWATLDGQSRFWYSTWEPPWGYGNQAVIAHEMGHGFGLPHSSGDYGLTYDNQWDVMSDTSTNCSRSTDPTFGCLGQHTISYHKDKLGWIPGAQKFVTSPGSFTISLEQMALPQTGNYRMALIPIAGSSTHFYTVEARRWAGYDVRLPGQAVIIHEVDTTRLNPAHVVDVDGNGNTGDAGARWEVGETFNNGANGVSVFIDSATSSGFVVTISLGGVFTPTATLSATQTSTSASTHTPTPSPTPTATPTSTGTPTRTPTATPSPSATYTNTPLPTAAPTSSSTPQPPATHTPTSTSTPMAPTATPINTATHTPLPPTATPTMTATNTLAPPTDTPTYTPVPPTATSTYTPSNTPVPPTPTATPIPPTATPTYTSTNTASPPTNTPIPPTATSSSTPVQPSNTPVPPTATSTNTPIPPADTAVPLTATPSSTPVLPSNTPVPPTATPTSTPLPSTATPTVPPTNTPTITSIPPTATPPPTVTPIPPTATTLPTNTPLSATSTPVPPTATRTATAIPPTATDTVAPSNTPEPSASATATSTRTPTATASATPSATATSVPPTATPTSESEVEDINQDGQVDVLDVQLVVNVFLGSQTNPEVVARADVNGDGAVNVLDVQAIVNAYLHG